MTSYSNYKTLEQLISQRDLLLKTIINLEMGSLSETKKIDEFEFYRNDKNFDKNDIDTQILRSKENLRSIQQVLNSEKDKLEQLNKEISTANQIINAHGIEPCLIGSVPHIWDILAKHPSGNFSHRKCRTCGTSEKVGHS